MRFDRNRYLRTIFLLGALVTSSGNVGAVANSCTYAASGSGIGGTGISGAGTGGTGIIAKGTGIGGTGRSPGVETGELQLAGNVIFSRGSVEAQSNGRSRHLAKGDGVCVGETIVTAQSGTVEIKMTDDGLVAVRPETQLKIEKFAYGGTDKDSSLMALFKGSSRFVTGKLGKLHPQNDLVETPTATIGVRGTDHEVTLILPGAGGGYPSGTYDKVNQGITFIRTDKGQIDIHPNQVGFAVTPGEMPILLKEVPDFYFINPAMTDESHSSGEGHKEDGVGENKKMDLPEEHSGNSAESAQPEETGAPSSEHPGNPNVERPESPALPEMPESQSFPESPSLQETLSAPQMPERPD
jgi:hypothetical protein